MSVPFTQFALETLLWTGALLGLVLVLRRPVARIFGAQAAYALWFLPLIRLALPPITLPAWMRPAETVIADGPEQVVTTVNEAPLALAGSQIVVEATPVADPVLVSPVDLLLPILVLWLAGAGVFLWRRFGHYFALRRELLNGARPVGEVGRIRLVETSATTGPVAFGILDKVIALPEGFMVSRDRQARDLAIEHELAHHRGRDLLVNVLVQPLFALHWFNPLGWAGWKALRRDQEAACDARVVAARPQEDRAVYADIIADFACRAPAISRPALVAPMACPVLGDKSIIHRLRSLNMNDVSPRRRLASRLTIGAAVIALPLTATISYAAADAEAPLPPLALAPPAPPQAPGAPRPPEAPLAPEAEQVELQQELAEVEREIDEVQDELREVEVEVRRELDEMAEHEEHRVVSARNLRALTAKERAEIKSALKVAKLEAREKARINEAIKARKLSAEDRAEIHLALAESMKELHLQLGEQGELRKSIRLSIESAKNGVPTVVTKCGTHHEIGESEVGADGRTRIFVCESKVNKLALDSVRDARKSIAKDKSLDAETKAEVLRSLDAEIAKLSS